jgi:hypothetical protein
MNILATMIIIIIMNKLTYLYKMSKIMNGKMFSGISSNYFSNYKNLTRMFKEAQKFVNSAPLKHIPIKEKFYVLNKYNKLLKQYNMRICITCDRMLDFKYFSVKNVQRDFKFIRRDINCVDCKIYYLWKEMQK